MMTRKKLFDVEIFPLLVFCHRQMLYNLMTFRRSKKTGVYKVHRRISYLLYIFFENKDDGCHPLVGGTTVAEVMGPDGPKDTNSKYKDRRKTILTYLLQHAQFAHSQSKAQSSVLALSVFPA